MKNLAFLKKKEAKKIWRNKNEIREVTNTIMEKCRGKKYGEKKEN